MKRVLGTALAAIVALLAFVAPAQAADLAHGGQIFSANCAACHLGGRNVVNAAKTLQKADLEQYGMASIEAITTQVTNGKGAMPAFGSKLSAEDIADVASYVLDQSEKGWQG
ncbi:cytochrome c6 PetJ [Synechococcus elongatus]|uniref:Cytochrome c6 n=1 Tax=Synechococcus elongatus PCC 11801 TaxID=2219813 RepID=A0AAN1UUZ0_SYNEL|nr:c-type cytochrome [Synechococcus elongatus]AZB73209.1 cytochrome c6 [Synechococcus elongatus PCC 11801]